MIIKVVELNATRLNLNLHRCFLLILPEWQRSGFMITGEHNVFTASGWLTSLQSQSFPYLKVYITIKAPQFSLNYIQHYKDFKDQEPLRVSPPKSLQGGGISTTVKPASIKQMWTISEGLWNMMTLTSNIAVKHVLQTIGSIQDYNRSW